MTRSSIVVTAWVLGLLGTSLPSVAGEAPVPKADQPRSAGDDHPPKRRGEGKPQPGGPRKPTMADTIKATIYADNWFCLSINGHLRIVDPIAFLPHNVVEVDLLPTYPMTIAVLVRDNADAKTGMEYDNTHIGDGGFILKFADGTVTNADWRVFVVSRGPLGGDTSKPTVQDMPIPPGWDQPEFDDSSWEHATVHTQEAIGPKAPFFEHDFTGAQWIWSKNLALDNAILLRCRVTAPASGKLPGSFVEGHIDAANRGFLGH